MKRVGKHAVVIGASMGGLLAARALSDYFETVTIIERDVFPKQDLPRKGVPQGRHAHGLLARGRNVIEAFFPGWTDEVVASGGSRGDIALMTMRMRLRQNRFHFGHRDHRQILAEEQEKRVVPLLAGGWARLAADAMRCLALLTLRLFDGLAWTVDLAFVMWVREREGR